MTEVIKTLATLFSHVSLVEASVFLIYCIVGCSVYFIFQIWFPAYSKVKEKELAHEDKKNEMLDETLKHMATMLQQNTDVIQGFNRSITILDNTLDKVSDKLHAHDAKTDTLESDLRSLNSEMNRFKETVPGLTDVNRIHQRLDEIKSNLSDKHDVNMILQRLDQLHDIALKNHN